MTNAYLIQLVFQVCLQYLCHNLGKVENKQTTDIQKQTGKQWQCREHDKRFQSNTASNYHLIVFAKAWNPAGNSEFHAIALHYTINSVDERCSLENKPVQSVF